MHRPRSLPRLAAAAALALSFALALLALLAPRTALAEPGDELTAYVITFGPGDHPFYKFGHDAIWIHDESAPKRDGMRRDPVFNYGTFAFDDPALIPKFVQGRFMYWLSVAPIDFTVRIYQRENRSVLAQELNLTAAQKKSLYDALRENAREENKYYKYDYYRDNCATRVRDMIDRAIGGKLEEASRAPASMTWRQHTLRLTADDVILSSALNVVMGSFIDRPLNQWEEMFLPAYVEEGLRRVKVPGPDGAEIPLVKSERSLATAKGRAPLRTEPPSWAIWHLLLGLAAGAALFFGAQRAKQSLPARIGVAALLFVAGFLSILGFLFCVVWIGTDHEVGWHNENILQFFPACIPLMGFAIGVARLKPASIKRARTVVTWALAAATLGLVWKVLPWMRQSNYWLIALCLPVWAGATFGLRSLERQLATSPAPAKTTPPGGKTTASGAKTTASDAKPEGLGGNTEGLGDKTEGPGDKTEAAGEE